MWSPTFRYISNLTAEMGRTRKAKEAFMTNQQKAVRLLETEYKERLDTMAFIQACAFLHDAGNAGTFITLTDLEFRDRYLEISLCTLLLNYQG